VKKVFLAALALVLVLAGGIWVFRYELLHFSAGAFLKMKVPENVSIERIVADHPERKITVYGIALSNKPGFFDPVFAEAKILTVHYRTRGKTIFSGIEITSFECDAPRIRLERLSNGTTNFSDVYIASPGGDPARLPSLEIKKLTGEGVPGNGDPVIRNISEAINITGLIPGKVRGGTLTFRDSMMSARPFTASFENINSDLAFKLDDEHQLVYIESLGKGHVNGDVSQRVNWKISADLQPAQITLSSRIEPENVDLVYFKPYYDRFAPVDITQGRVWGTVVVDLHRGNIGSDNILRFRNLEFRDKDTTGASRFWGANIADVAGYLRQSSGETVFDFKIKGPVENPRFYPGPNVARAAQSMAIDKIGELIRRTTRPDGASETAETPKSASDIDSVIDMFKGLMKD
jgi:hypothetical protein